KSTLLSVTSNARPKIANYHFTTLFPNLGVIYVDEGVSFVMADIPGIIEGASEGAGLGHDFLRHIDRCRLLVHVVDVSGSEGRDPVEDFDTITAELEQYSTELAKRPQIVVANKSDIMTDPALLDALREHVEALGYPLYTISAATHQGTRQLVLKIAEQLSTLPPVIVYEPEYVPRPPVIDTSAALSIEVEDNTYIVEGPWLERLISNVNFGDYESRMFFDKMLRDAGVFTQLEERGIQDGDIVSMYNLEFEYQR
ncbi:MAG: Obg family GTPase CgtA, partial [Oscillospiraceae bacterium]|nr:Obg family GTPase CgtA [Oscillospiraceae bacterium]